MGVLAAVRPPLRAAARSVWLKPAPVLVLPVAVVVALPVLVLPLNSNRLISER